MAAARRAPREVRTFCTVLHDTGCRISEALELVPGRIDLAAGAITIRTLKKRRQGVYRAVPVPPGTLDQLDLVHGLRDAQRRGKGYADSPLWRWSRMTACRRVLEVMEAAAIPDGPHRCPKGLRHGYGVHAISSGVPLNMLCKWMGHASITAIYANALGAEEQGIAARNVGVVVMKDDPYEWTLLDRVRLMQEALIATATQDPYPEGFDYTATRREFLQSSAIKDRLPDYVKRCRDPDGACFVVAAISRPKARAAEGWAKRSIAPASKRLLAVSGRLVADSGIGASNVAFARPHRAVSVIRCWRRPGSLAKSNLSSGG